MDYTVLRLTRNILILFLTDQLYKCIDTSDHSYAVYLILHKTYVCMRLSY